MSIGEPDPPGPFDASSAKIFVFVQNGLDGAMAPVAFRWLRPRNEFIDGPATPILSATAIFRTGSFIYEVSGFVVGSFFREGPFFVAVIEPLYNTMVVIILSYQRGAFRPSPPRRCLLATTSLINKEIYCFLVTSLILKPSNFYCKKLLKIRSSKKKMMLCERLA